MLSALLAVAMVAAGGDGGMPVFRRARKIVRTFGEIKPPTYDVQAYHATQRELGKKARKALKKAVATPARQKRKSKRKRK